MLVEKLTVKAFQFLRRKDIILSIVKLIKKIKNLTLNFLFIKLMFLLLMDTFLI